MKTKIELSELLKQITPLPWKAERAKDADERDYFEINGDGPSSGTAVADLCGRGDHLPLAQSNAAYLYHCANVLPELVEAATSAEKLLRQNLAANHAALKDADPDSQFYGEDIVTPPILNRLASALARAEKVSLP